MLRKVYLEITDSCNLECKICYRHQWAQAPVDMQKDLFEKILKEVENDPEIQTVVLGGMGEPLLSPWFEEAVKALAHKEIWVTSNGTLFKEKLTPSLVSAIHLMVVSIDGMDQHMIQERGVAFRELLDNLDHLNRLKQEAGSQLPHLDVQFVASSQNIKEIFPLMDVLAEKKVRNIIISHLLPQDMSQKDDILYTRYENKEVKKLFHKIRNYSFRRGLRIIFPEAELKTERKCAFVNNDATYVTSRGEVVPCYRLSHQGTEVVFGRPKTIRQYSFGNLQNKSLREIWNDEGYRRFREKIFNNHYPSCPDCDLVEGCSLIHDVDFDCHGESPNCADCLWSRKFVFCN